MTCAVPADEWAGEGACEWAGEMHGEHRPAGHAVDGHGAAVRSRDSLHDGEAEAGRARLPGPRGVAAREPFEDVRKQFRRDAGAVVLDVEADPVAVPVHAGGDGGAGRCVRTGVGEQVDEDLVQARGVGEHGGRFVGELQAPRVVLVGGAGIAERVDDQG